MMEVSSRNQSKWCRNFILFWEICTAKLSSGITKKPFSITKITEKSTTSCWFTDFEVHWSISSNLHFSRKRVSKSHLSKQLQSLLILDMSRWNFEKKKTINYCQWMRCTISHVSENEGLHNMKLRGSQQWQKSDEIVSKADLNAPKN